MLKFLHVYKNYYLGLSLMGIVAFLVQEIPYIIMPLVKPKTNPIMNMQDEVKWIAVVQSIFGVLSMVMLMTLVRDDIPIFSISIAKEKVFFSLMICMILINFIGWAFYYTGHQYG